MIRTRAGSVAEVAYYDLQANDGLPEIMAAIDATRTAGDKASAPETTLMTVCSWCGKVIKWGNSKKVSHGICEKCAANVTAAATRTPSDEAAR